MLCATHFVKHVITHFVISATHNVLHGNTLCVAEINTKCVAPLQNVLPCNTLCVAANTTLCCHTFPCHELCQSGRDVFCDTNTLLFQNFEKKFFEHIWNILNTTFGKLVVKCC